MIKLIIFDLDGTLLNTINDLGNSCNYVLQKHGLPTHSIDSYRYFVGSGIANLIKRAIPEDKRKPEYIESLRKEFISYYSEHAEDDTAPYEGIIDLLREIEQRGVKMAVASNKFMAGTQSLVGKYFGNFGFCSVIGQREGIPVKPDPQIVFDVMGESGVSNKAEILYVGDSGVDMQTASNAGVSAVGVLWGFRDKEELAENGANFLVSKPSEILELL